MGLWLFDVTGSGHLKGNESTMNFFVHQRIIETYVSLSGINLAIKSTMIGNTAANLHLNSLDLKKKIKGLHWPS